MAIEMTKDDKIAYLAPASCGLYGKKYLTAENLNDLEFLAAEACCLAAFEIVKIFHLPNRGRLILDVMKKYKRRSWEQYLFFYNNTFTHCLAFITRQFQRHIGRELQIDSQLLADKLFAYGGKRFSTYCGYRADEESHLLQEMDKRLFDYGPYHELEAKLLFENIKKSLGDRIKPVDIAVFFRKTLAEDPLLLTEPLRFCDQYKILMC